MTVEPRGDAAPPDVIPDDTRRDAPPRNTGAMNRELLAWFAAHRRDLGFRRTGNPYSVLVSEVMLQQTQAPRVEAAWEAFVARFPTVEALASASPAEVIRAWGTLGYNRRAVRLRRAAQAIVERHDGAVPDALAALEALPGVGPYTARAVAAIAFGQPFAALDTNIARVLGRVVGREVGHELGQEVAPFGGQTGSRAAFQCRADGLVDPARPADWTHAMMDVGALLCRPRAPRCAECPLAMFCRSADLTAKPVAMGAAISRRSSARPRGTLPATPFPATRRWLRGRVVQRLREERPGRWIRLDDPIGIHPREAVSSALQQLAAEGLVERDGRGRARLPLSHNGRRAARVA